MITFATYLISDRTDAWPHYLYCAEHKHLLNKSHLWECEKLWQGCQHYDSMQPMARRDHLYKNLTLRNNSIPERTIGTETWKACLAMKRLQFNIAHQQLNLGFYPCKDTAAKAKQKIQNMAATAIDAWEKAEEVNTVEDAEKLYQLAKKKELYK